MGKLLLALSLTSFPMWFAFDLTSEPDTPAKGGTGTPIASGQRDSSEERIKFDHHVFANLEGAIKDFGSIREEFGVAGAKELSRQCFSGLKQYPALSLLDRCLAFDTVGILLSMRHRSDVGQEEYFSTRALDSRFAQAASLFDGEAQAKTARKKEIERLTFSIVARSFVANPGGMSADQLVLHSEF